MRELNPTIYGVNAIILNWYDLIVFAMLGITIFGMLWIFYDSRRKNVDPLIWKALIVIATVFLIPSVAVAIDERFAQKVIDAVPLLAYLGIFASFLGIVSILGYLAKTGYDSEMDYNPTTNIDQPNYNTPSTPWEVTPLPINISPTIPPPLPMGQNVADNNVKTEFYNKNNSDSKIGTPLKPAKTELLQVEPEEMAYLMVQSGHREGNNYRLGNEVTIGRDAKQCDILLDDSLCSTQHAKVKLDNGRFTIYDLGSSNGTLVNNTKIDKHTLEDKDQITIGKTKFVFVQVS